jgi:hypothetical protein
MDEFRLVGVLWRVAFALALVFVTFNPTGHSYYHWLADGFPPFSRSRLSRVWRSSACGSSSCAQR